MNINRSDVSGFVVPFAIGPADAVATADWLAALLDRNRHCDYLRRHGAPQTLAEFRDRLPVVAYDTLVADIERVASGEPDVLFSGRPLAFERTGGSAGGSKLIPYSAEGLADIRRAVLPWLAETLCRHRIEGRVYFAISPAARMPETLAGVPVGLTDAAYLGDAAGAWLIAHSAVPVDLTACTDIGRWRAETLRHLAVANDLELISVWSPTFLLRLLEGPDSPGTPECLWPRLKVLSCWLSGPSAAYAERLRALFPHAAIEQKGLLSTEAVVTVPNADGRPQLVAQGFTEFRDAAGGIVDAEEIEIGGEYEAIVTTASGLYRYATGDRVRHVGWGREGRPVLEFLGRNALVSDLVGEKLCDAFVVDCLAGWNGFATLLPDAEQPGYVLVSETPFAADAVANVETRLSRNPQYDYARRLGQLAPLRGLHRPRAFAVVEAEMRSRGVRLGDVKPTALRREAFWLARFQEDSA